MATKNVPSIELSFGELVGIRFREALDSESGITRGYRAASDPVLIEARQQANLRRRVAISERLLHELRG